MMWENFTRGQQNRLKQWRSITLVYRYTADLHWIRIVFDVNYNCKCDNNAADNSSVVTVSFFTNRFSCLCSFLHSLPLFLSYSPEPSSLAIVVVVNVSNCNHSSG